MRKPQVNPARILLIVIAALSVAVLSGLGLLLVRNSRTTHLTLAAGSPSSESYIIGRALKSTLERNYPKIRITLLETGGTAENLAMLEDGRAELATAQADIVPGPSARSVAVMYDDVFQLLTPAASPIHKFADLKGRRIALARSGGQYESFLSVAKHFGLPDRDFQFVGATDADADAAFSAGQADAIFRVRTLGNPAIQKLVRGGAVRFLPIEQAAAMKIEQPAFEPAVIPQGGYLGSPAVPAEDLPTVAVHRMFLASAAADEGAVRAVTEALLEHRHELIKEIPQEMTEVRLLLAQVRRPEPQAGLGPPLHAGALDFYNRDKPSFLAAHADYVGLMITVAVMIGSWIWELKQWMQRRQKNAADRYSNRAVELMGEAKDEFSPEKLDQIWRSLLELLAEAVDALDGDSLSEESFESFRSILQIALDVTKERRAFLNSSRAVA
jgi:uncharacterized protein